MGIPRTVGLTHFGAVACGDLFTTERITPRAVRLNWSYLGTDRGSAGLASERVSASWPRLRTADLGAKLRRRSLVTEATTGFNVNLLEAKQALVSSLVMTFPQALELGFSQGRQHSILLAFLPTPMPRREGHPDPRMVASNRP